MLNPRAGYHLYNPIKKAPIFKEVWHPCLKNLCNDAWIELKEEMERKNLRPDHWPKNPNRWKYDRLLEHLAKVITRYSGEGRPMPFTWPAPAGEHSRIPAYRVKVSYEYWRYFMGEGRRKLQEYNKENNCKIEINKEQTLLLRKKITALYKNQNKKVPEMSVKKGRLNIGRELSLKPAVAAIKLRIDLSEWQKTPLVELLSDSELKDYEAGELAYGSLKLPGLEMNVDESAKEGNQTNEAVDRSCVNGVRKRIHEDCIMAAGPSSKINKINNN
ncbi:hypothetical protein Aduo_018798 [Ancylostoma duodenale]